MLRDTLIRLSHDSLLHLDSDDHLQYALTIGDDRAVLDINAPFIDQVIAVDSTTGNLYNTGVISLDRITAINSIDYNLLGTPPAHSEGLVFYDAVTHSLSYYNDVDDITIKIGQETVIKVRNNSGVTIPDGSAVYITGALGNRPTIALAIATSSNSSKVIGLATHNIPHNSDGYVTARGTVNGLNTNIYTEGDVLYLSETVPGGFIANVPPNAPNYATFIGTVTISHLTQGAILVNPQYNCSLMELSDVNGSIPQDGNLLVYDGTAEVWNAADAEHVVLENFGNVTDEPTGIYDITESTVSWANSSPHFTITPVGSTFKYYIHGVEYNVGAKTATVSSPSEGIWHFYLDENENLVYTNTFTFDLLKDYAYVANAYWDNSNLQWITHGDERHGIVMDWATHEYLHTTFGAQYKTGMAILDLATASSDNNGAPTTDRQNQFTIQAGTFADEDITNICLQQGTSTPFAAASIPLFYRSGITWRRNAVSFRLTQGTVGERINYNQITTGSGSQVQVTNNNYYVLTHIFAINDSSVPYIAIQGQNQYSTRDLARTGAQNELSSIFTLGLPIQEFTPIATLIYQTSNDIAWDTYGNIKLVSSVAGVENTYVDWRGGIISRSIVSTAVSGTSGTSGSSGTSGTSPTGLFIDPAGDIYYYDTSRTKYLGAGIIQQDVSRNSNATTNLYLSGEGDTPTNLNGFVLPWNATLVGISMSENLNTQTWTAEVRRNGVATVLDSLTITNQSSNYNSTKNTDLNAGDRVQIYCNGTSIDYPKVTLFFRRRL